MRDVLWIDVEGERYAFPAEPRSDARDAGTRRQEDLHFGARDTLENLRGRGPSHWPWQRWLVYAAERVARRFEVDKDELLALWLKHYGCGILYDFPAWLRHYARPATTPP